MPRIAAFLCLVIVFAMPCQSGSGTPISSVADCRSIGGIGFWSNPAIWYPMQVPDNGRPRGASYEVDVPRSNCLTIYLDQSVTINSFSMVDGFFTPQKKTAKVRANSVSFTVLRDARIDDLNMTNAGLTIGGQLWISGLDGWTLTDSKVKAQSYLQDYSTQTVYLRSTIETAGKTTITGDASAYLTQSSLETRDLELSNGSLRLNDGAIVRVRRNFSVAGTSAVNLSVQLNGVTSFTIDGNAQIAGRLSGFFTDGYVPSIGEEFPILHCRGTISGSWSLYSPPPLPAGRTWTIVADDHNVSLKVISAP